MNRIILAYCHENVELADSLDRHLVRIGIPFERICDMPGDTIGVFAARLLQNTEPVILIVTENLLKSRACLTELQPALEKMVQDKQYLIAVADGKISKDGGLTFEYVPTHFDRMVYALQYMNYWQNAWLDLSSQQQQAESAAEKAAIEPELDATRKVANHVGEMLAIMKDAGFVSWEQLEADEYSLFFRNFGLNDWHEQYRRLTQYEAPPLPETDAATPMVAMPTLRGPLAPVVVGTPELDATPEIPSETVDYSGINSLLEELAEEESFEVPAHALEGPDVLRAASEGEGLSEHHGREYSDSDIRQTIRDAWFWLEKGHAEQGLELLRLTLEQHPDNVLLQTEYNKALAQYATQAETSAPDVPDAALNEPEALVENHRQIVEREPIQNTAQDAKSYDLMGDMAAEKGDYLFAKYCWDRAAELDPKFPGIYRKLGIMTSEHLRADYKETALHYLQKALEQDPDDAELHLWMADAALQNGDPAQAEQWYLRAIVLQPEVKTPENDHLYTTSSPAQAEVAPEEAAPVPEVGAGLAPALAPALALVKPDKILTVLITGATSGIGRATADLFARNGHRLILTGRRAERLSALKAQFETDFHSEVLMLPFDVRDQRTVEQTLEHLPESWQQIDILVNNAGLAKGFAPIHEGDIDHWETMIDTNLKGLLYVTRAVSPGMVRRRQGHIINVGSAAGKEVYPNGNVYCATKFAVDALTNSMRLDLHQHNIRVSQVSPGHVEETDFALTRFDGNVERAKIYKDFQALRAADVADVIYFMATRPPHVNIQDVWMFSTQQASVGVVDRSGRG